jgi:L-seryl-tRNA(Ser) seleniumtransferase
VSLETTSNGYRVLPSVDQVLSALEHLAHLPRPLITSEIRAVLSERRRQIAAGNKPGPEKIEHEVERRLAALLRPSLRPVINATGVVLHTNLGRAPLADFQPIGGYSNLEYDLASGKRGKRDQHWISLLNHLLDRPSIVVNNNAAAVFLALQELAAGFEVIISRGELIEIGDGFRIPEIMNHSGVVLREVGSTNRTRIEDYRNAITDRTRLILRVHPSNFRITGFTGQPSLKELTTLGRESGIPVYQDLGSGCLVDLHDLGIEEPLVRHSFEAGVNLVSFSCDKLLGGPQSGIIAGDPELIQRIRRNPLYRTFRVDKLVLESLQATFRNLLLQNWEALPTLHMISCPVTELHRRAQHLAARLAPLNVRIREGESAIGGGATPGQTLKTWLVQLSVPSVDDFAHQLRQAPIPVIARIEENWLTFDLRTVAPKEEESLLAAIQTAAVFSASAPSGESAASPTLPN